MQTEDDTVSVFQMLMYIFQLAGKHMGHGILHRCGDVDDRFSLFRRLPHIKNRVAHLHGIIYLCPRKAFRTVLERKVPVCLRGKLKK